MAPILVSMEAPGDYTALKYNLDLPCVICFLLFPYLPWLVALERRTTVSNGQKDKY